MEKVSMKTRANRIYRKSAMQLLSVPSEGKEQAMLIEMITLKYPHAIYRVGMESGKRNPMIAKKQGINSGWPDIYFPYAAHGYRDLYIELKKQNEKLFKKDKVTPKDTRIANQIMIMDFLKSGGSYAAFCFGAKEAIKIIDWYLMGNISFNPIKMSDVRSGKV